MPTNEPGGISYERALAEMRAWRALAAGNLVMFGYWASTWSSLNGLSERKDPTPFRPLILVGRAMVSCRLRHAKERLQKGRTDGSQ